MKYPAHENLPCCGEFFNAHHKRLYDEFTALLRKCGEYEKALEFYAENRNYDFNPLPVYRTIDDVGVVTSNIETDEGDLARKVLSNNKQPEDYDG